MLPRNMSPEDIKKEVAKSLDILTPINIRHTRVPLVTWTRQMGKGLLLLQGGASTIHTWGEMGLPIYKAIYRGYKL